MTDSTLGGGHINIVAKQKLGDIGQCQTEPLGGCREM